MNQQMKALGLNPRARHHRLRCGCQGCRTDRKADQEKATWTSLKGEWRRQPVFVLLHKSLPKWTQDSNKGSKVLEDLKHVSPLLIYLTTQWASLPGAETLMLTIIQKDIVTVRNTVGNFSALGGTLAYLSVKENTKSSTEDLPTFVKNQWC